MGEGLLQPLHLLVIAFIALMVFGPKKLPELGKGMGQAIRGFKESMKEGKEEETLDRIALRPSALEHAYLLALIGRAVFIIPNWLGCVAVLAELTSARRSDDDVSRPNECNVAYSELALFGFFNRDRFGRFIRRLSPS